MLARVKLEREETVKNEQKALNLRAYMEQEADKLRYPFKVSAETRRALGYDKTSHHDLVLAWDTFHRVLCEWNDLEPKGPVKYLSTTNDSSHRVYIGSLDSFVPAGDVDFIVDLK